MTYYLIGSKGRLGRSIASEFANDGIVCLDRSIYESWALSGSSELVAKYFDAHSNNNATVFVASGLLDPKLSQEDLFSVNYTLPKNVIDGAGKIGIKVITFGTVMEGLLSSKNTYVQSKTSLNEYVQTVADENKPVVHIQLHTLYGKGQPSPFMFLGKILLALKNNAVFNMTSGRQLREYHHFSDEVSAIRKIADLSAPGVVNLSHGKPIRLKNIAQNVFDAFDKSHLLRVGALPEPPDENYDKIFQSTDVVQKVSFRNSLPAIVDYMRGCYAHKTVRS